MANIKKHQFTISSQPTRNSFWVLQLTSQCCLRLFPGSISTGHLLGICPLCCSRWWRPHQLGQSFLIKFNNPRPCRHPASNPPFTKSCLWFMIPQRSAPKNYLKSKFLLISKAFYWTFAIFDARTRGNPSTSTFANHYMAGSERRRRIAM